VSEGKDTAEQTTPQFLSRVMWAHSTSILGRVGIDDDSFFSFYS
jgi:hypothetical protein